MVSAPVRVRAPIAEKYIAMRTQSFTRTHQLRLQRWIDESRGTEAEYFAWFRQEVNRMARKWEQDVAAIEGDPNLSLSAKQAERNKLTRLWPSWTLEQEERFIAQWGDPRNVDRGRLEALLIDLQSPQWDNAMRAGQMQVVNKTEWQRKFYGAVVNPQDGSVPLYMNAADITPAPSVSEFDAADEEYLPLDIPETPRETTLPTGDIKAPEVAGLYLSEKQQAEFAAHIQLVAKRTCPVCRTYFPSGLKPQHVGSNACRTAQEALAK